MRASSGRAYSYVAADTTGADVSYQAHDMTYERVQRHLLWLKSADGSGPDRVIVYDLVDRAADAGPRDARWQLHLDAAPQIDGLRATVPLGDQRLEVEVPLPTGVALTAREPEGAPSQFPGEVYTHRLFAEPDPTDPNLRMVAVIRATDADRAATPPVTVVQNDDVIALVDGADVIVFPRAPLAPTPPAPVALALDGTLPSRAQVWWTGLTPGAAYEVSAADGHVELRPGGVHEADSAGVLVVTQP